MQTLKLRAGSSEMAHKTSPSAPNPKASPFRTTKATPVSSDSKPSKVLERKPSSKGTSLPEKRIVRVSEMQQQLGQLQEELKRAKEEKTQALGELAEVKNGMKRKEDDVSSHSKNRIQMLELEVEKAKESEGKMLESLISQTKHLEQTKILLEEAKLEIRSLQKSIGNSWNSENHVEKNSSLDAILAQKETEVLRNGAQELLRNELELAMDAEEKSKKAMDDLALALKEVTTEANQVNRRLSSTQSDLENVRAEVVRLEALLKISDEKFQLVVEESERVKLEMEESIAAWTEKEKGFINCMKVSEEEISKAIEENDRLTDSLRLSRDDNSKLRDIMKQALNEATVVKGASEIARKENSQLKDLASEKENALQSIKQEYECLKVTEAAALDSVRELKMLLAPTSTMDLGKTAGSLETGSFGQPKAIVNEVRGSKSMVKFPSDHWKSENPRFQNGCRHSMGEAGKFTGSVFHTDGSQEQKDRTLASISNFTDSRVPSALFTEDGESVNLDDFYHIDMNQLDGMERERGSPTKQKKKKPMLRRFGDMLRRSSFHK